MTTYTLIKRSLRFYWRTHLGVMLGAAVSTAILVGALIIGDSVQHSLKRLALLRLGNVQFALNSQNRYFRAELADELETALGTATAPVILLRGIAANSDGTARHNHVQVLGVDERFWALGDTKPMFDDFSSDGVVLNDRLAKQLGVHEGEEILLRVEKPEFLPRDAPLSTDADLSVAMRLIVKAIASDSNFGRFSLQANQIAPSNAFIRLAWLQQKIELLDRANMLLEEFASSDAVGNGLNGNPTIANTALREHWKLADAELQLRDLSHEQGVLELRTNRVFLDPPVANAVMRAIPDAIGILTYFVNELRLKDRSSPYSVVAAIGITNSGKPESNVIASEAKQPKAGESESRKDAIRNTQYATLTDISDDEILINKWLADDLQANPGDHLELTYFVIGTPQPQSLILDRQIQNTMASSSPELAKELKSSPQKLEERSSRFRIRAILPMDNPIVDRELMPKFPGLSDAENCRDWEPGIPIDLDKIRKKDEEYWARYRGTPKAFVTLKAGQRMWGNRFGNLTALRFHRNSALGSGRIPSMKTKLRSPLKTETFHKVKCSGSDDPERATPRSAPIGCSLYIAKRSPDPIDLGDPLASIEDLIREELDPASIGLFFQPVRKQALKASSQALDFGQLFLGLSFFLITAAVLLTGLLFVFGVEQRTEEVGTLLALGFPPYRVRRLLLFEGSVLALLGGIVGTGGGILYTKMMLYALSTIWRGAVGGTSSLQYYAKPFTLVVGGAVGIVIALLAIWVTLRKQAKRSARELLTSGTDLGSSLLMPALARSKFGLWVTVVAIVGTLMVLGLLGDKSATTAFFISGALLLVAGLGLSQALLSMLARKRENDQSVITNLAGLGMRNSARRIGRSLATVALLACGSFMIIAVGANRYDPHEKADLRSSGTGGFALFAESAMPIFKNGDGLKAKVVDAFHATRNTNHVNVVPLRVHEGDDASCLNLNRAQAPRLLGIQPEELEKRNAFTFVETVEDDDRWLMLEREDDEDTVSAIGDEATIIWALGKSVGDTLSYVDERGNTFKIRLVGMIANSIFQGGLLISEDDFVKRFPSESGYRMFLIDVHSPTKLGRSEKVQKASKTLSRAMQDVGLDLTPTAQRLAEFNTVQNTYLSIFQILGGLAMLLGSVGLGIIVLRNVMERRSELALLRAVGFENRSLRLLVLSEHWLLLLLGLACGVAAGLVAVLPALRSSGTNIPYPSLTLTLLAVVLSAGLWIWLATMLALRGPLLDSLRNE